MSKLSAVKEVVLSIRASGVKEFGFVQLAEEVNRRIGWTYQDTVRKYIRDLLSAEIPTERVRKGVYRFLQEPSQGRIWG